MASLTREVVFTASLLWLLADGTYYDFGHPWRPCGEPVTTWTVVSYHLFLVGRVCYIVGSLVGPTDSGDFMLNMRHPGVATQVLYWVTWVFCLPVHGAWTAVGALRVLRVRASEPDCLHGPQLLFLMVWLGLGCAWLLVHVWLFALAIRLERRHRRTQQEFTTLLDEEMASRWGEAGQAPDDVCEQGLAVAEIKALPGAARWGEWRAAQCEDQDCDCPICLEPLQDDDAVRTLGSCGHTFHRACIDLWLFRCASCPMCKSEVRPAPEGVPGLVLTQRRDVVHV